MFHQAALSSRSGWSASRDTAGRPGHGRRDTSPGGETTVVVGDPDAKGGGLRNFVDTIGQVIVSSPARIRLLGLFPHSQLAGGVVPAFGSLWVTNFDAGTVERYALPKP